MRLGVELSDEFHKRIKRMTARAGYPSMSALVRELLEKWLAEQESLEVPQLGTLVFVGVKDEFYNELRRKAVKEGVIISGIGLKSLAGWLDKEKTVPIPA